MIPLYGQAATRTRPRQWLIHLCRALILPVFVTLSCKQIAVPAAGPPAPSSTAIHAKSTATSLQQQTAVMDVSSTATHAKVIATPAATPSAIPTSETPDSAGDDKFLLSYNPLVAEMIGEIEQGAVSGYLAALTGEDEITIGADRYTLETRDQYDEESISLATQYAYDFMEAQGLSVSFHRWKDDEEELAGRNVVGEIKGSVRPDEIVLITAHLDSINEEDEEGAAPGADDNASGSVAVMLAAQQLAGHSFERTIRFILFTGEEVNLCGSHAYAEEAKENQENIVAVFNMDMIGWDGNNDGIVSLETRDLTDSHYASDLAIADVFIQVVKTYNLGSRLVPSVNAIRDEEVDSWSFWELDYPSVTAIEDFSSLEMNPSYHTEDDTLETLNLSFFTAFAKASLATAAHLAIPLE